MRTAPSIQDHSSAPAILGRWTAFAEALVPDTIDLIDTEDAVAALIDRSLLQDRLDVGDELSSVEYGRLEQADRYVRIAAPTLVDRTQIELFRDDEPAYHWWWRLNDLVLGETGQVLLDVPAAAALKGVHPHTIRLAVKDGLLPARRLARGFLIHRRDLELWQPRRVGRPRIARRAPSDVLLESFNEANSHADFEKAGAIAQALELDPSTSRRKLAVALARYNESDYQDALRWTGQALEGDLPQTSRQTCLLVQGRCLLALGRAKQARATLRRAAGLGHVDALVDAALADTYLALDQPDKAVACAQEAVNIAPTIPELKFVLARMEWHANLVGAALEHVVECRAAIPDHEAATVLFASVLGVLGDRTKDQSFYDRVIHAVTPLADTSAEAAQALGTAYSRSDRAKDALKLMRRIVREHRGNDDWLHAARQIGGALVEDAAANPDEAASLAGTVEPLVGPQRYVTTARVVERAIAGDVASVLQLLQMDSIHDPSTDEAGSVAVLVALTTSGKPADGTEIARALINAQAGPDVTLLAIRAAIAAEEVALARQGLERLSAEQGTTGMLATLALEIHDAGERHGRESALMTQALAQVGANQAVPGAPDRTAVAAPDSRWEGLHTARTASLDQLISTSH